MPAIRNVIAVRLSGLFALASAFELPYKMPMTLADALTIIERDLDQHFYPEVTGLFKKIAPELYARAVHAGDAELR
jgi:HD-GYP domain-containing protein (c-di-GMP phosphodiesterase class II)